MIKIPIEIGDIVRVGKFKNKRIKVKTIEYDEYGLPLINGRPLLTMRIEKLIDKQTQTETNMKTAELRKLIREEVEVALKEIDAPMDYSHMKPFKQLIEKELKSLSNLNLMIEKQGPLSEEIADAIDSLTELLAKIK